MTYLRSLLISFLIVFFVNRISPGIYITHYQQIPTVMSDIVFCSFVGFLNASVVPCYSILDVRLTTIKIAIANALISYGAFIVIAIVPFGVEVINIAGILVGGSIVWLVSFFANYLEKISRSFGT
ncbi:MAG: hypothetical protein HW387_411 [Parachlamydiales bacterium]|nr:hypothetical protein [Parachlamydiales bacterium]